jgi:hypothetical protein
MFRDELKRIELVILARCLLLPILSIVLEVHEAVPRLGLEHNENL